MGKILSPSSIRRQNSKKAKIKIGGVSGDSSNKTLALADSLGIVGRTGDITESIEKLLLNLGVKLEFEELTYKGDIKVNDRGLLDEPSFKGITDFNRIDETSSLQKIVGTSKMTKENVAVLAESFTSLPQQDIPEPIGSAPAQRRLE